MTNLVGKQIGESFEPFVIYVGEEGFNTLAEILSIRIYILDLMGKRMCFGPGYGEAEKSIILMYGRSSLMHYEVLTVDGKSLIDQKTMDRFLAIDFNKCPRGVVKKVSVCFNSSSSSVPALTSTVS